jgi:hypothetical protein
MLEKTLAREKIMTHTRVDNGKNFKIKLSITTLQKEGKFFPSLTQCVF